MNTSQHAALNQPSESGDMAPMALSRFKAGKPRRSVLLQATELFCKLTRPSAKQISQFKEQFYVLVNSSSLQDRRIISASLAANEYTPRTIAIYLAMEVPEIAAPMLLLSPVLGDLDFVNIITKSSDEHLLVIARRAELTPRVCDALCETGKVEVMKLLLANPSVKANAEQVTRVSTSLLSQEPATENAEPVQETTLEQPENPVATPAMETPEKKQEFWKKPAVASTEQLLALAGRGGRLGREGPKNIPGIYADTPDRIGADFLRSARSADLEACAEYVFQKCGLKKAIARGLISEPGGESLCLLMKAMSFPTATASQALLLLNSKSGRSVGNFKRLMSRYETLEANVCQEFLTKLGANFQIMQVKANERDRRSRKSDTGFAAAISERRAAVASAKQQAPQDRAAETPLKKVS